jgi:hypothetical protein
MSLISHTKSLKKFVSDSKNFSRTRFDKTKKILKEFEFLSTDACSKHSEKLTKKIVYMCNHNFIKDDGSRLRTAEEILIAWMKSAKLNSIKVSESIIKLLVITYINQSFLYQSSKPLKSIESIIKATKLAEQHAFKSHKGKLLKFISKLRQCELYIYMQKYDLGIICAQKVLEEVMKKLEKPNRKKMIQELTMSAVTAFYRIGICEQSKGLQNPANLAFERARIIGQKYLNKNNLLLELDYEMIINRKLSFKKIPKKTKRIKITDSSTFKTFEDPKINEPAQLDLEKKIEESINPRRKSTSMLENSEKIPGHYYTQEELEKLMKILKNEQSTQILNTDNFFFNKISKILKIKDTLKASPSLRKSTPEHLDEFWKLKEDLKKRKKNKKYQSDDLIRPPKVESQIDQIQDIFERKMKSQEDIMKHKLKTKIYKQLLRSINISSKSQNKILPTQRLFFRPPGTIKDGQKDLSFEKQKTEVSPSHDKKIEEIKQEIEDQMDDLLHEINGKSNFTDRIEVKNTSKLASSTLRIRPGHHKLKSKISMNSIAKPKAGKGILKKETS